MNWIDLFSSDFPGNKLSLLMYFHYVINDVLFLICAFPYPVLDIPYNISALLLIGPSENYIPSSFQKLSICYLQI